MLFNPCNILWLHRFMWIVAASEPVHFVTYFVFVSALAFLKKCECSIKLSVHAKKHSTTSCINFKLILWRIVVVCEKVICDWSGIHSTTWVRIKITAYFYLVRTRLFSVDQCIFNTWTWRIDIHLCKSFPLWLWVGLSKIVFKMRNMLLFSLLWTQNIGLY